MPRRDLNVVAFEQNHITPFLAHAGEEGWLSHQWELEFLIRWFPRGCHVVLQQDRPVGFITAVKYGTSGWVGNLLVVDQYRGHGLGGLLLQRAVDALSEAGADVVWLTASPSGQPLYEKMGFRVLDRIFRWRRDIGQPGGDGSPGGMTVSHNDKRLDHLGWGDDRTILLEKIWKRGSGIMKPSGFCIIQPGREWSQIGPWSSTDKGEAEGMLETVVLKSSNSGCMYVDTPGGNDDVGPILERQGFRQCGSAMLMFRGCRPAYRPEYIYGLASMGSMG